MKILITLSIGQILLVDALPRSGPWVQRRQPRSSENTITLFDATKRDLNYNGANWMNITSTESADSMIGQNLSPKTMSSYSMVSITPSVSIVPVTSTEEVLSFHNSLNSMATTSLKTSNSSSNVTRVELVSPTKKAEYTAVTTLTLTTSNTHSPLQNLGTSTDKMTVGEIHSPTEFVASVTSPRLYAATSKMDSQVPEPDLNAPTERYLASAPLTTTISRQRFQDSYVLFNQSSAGIPPVSAGTVITSLETSGHPTGNPLISTLIPSPTTVIATSMIAIVQPQVSEFAMAASTVSSDIFQAIATTAIPSVIGNRSDHPVPRLGIKDINTPISTNKFYANFFLGSQTASSWTHPYSVAWSKGGGATRSWGLAISHVDASERVYGPPTTVGADAYFINPIGIQSLVLSEASLNSSTALSTDGLTAFSANVSLSPKTGASPVVTFPLVQGMGFITGIYSGGTPVLESGISFKSITKATMSAKPGVAKYTIILNDNTTWFLYAFSTENQALDIAVVNDGLAKAKSAFSGTVQIAKSPNPDAEALYDASCGVYPTSASISGSVNGSLGSYTLKFEKQGMMNATLLMFALPHHIETLAPALSGSTKVVTSLQLNTTTKGVATAVVADSWTLTEELPTTMGFAPWSPTMQDGKMNSTLSASTIATIHEIALSEVSQDMNSQTNLNSMYYSGKALAKFAGIVYTIHDLLNDKTTAQAGLNNLKTAFKHFSSNQQDFPLVYDNSWKGVVSTASYGNGSSGADFGNTYYNDHHFHYGYFIYAAAVIGYIDPSWLEDNKDYVNMLVRDIANPSTTDDVFPVSRMFDWYHGHSWAHGLYETFDGKDQESSSEDSMSAYAIKMWGQVVGDANMEARGNLQLALTARSLQSYFLYSSNNTVEPANFIGNKVSGILFENKIDHTSYFGNLTGYIQGIHMLPLLPSSTLTRKQDFVTEEWNTYFSNGRADAVVGGWKGVLYANYAIINPQAAYKFFTQSNFDSSWLDGGASRTWYLALAAGLGGSS